MSEVSPSPMTTAKTGPQGLHHAAYVTADQEATRHFYEDLIGLPLTQFWIEREEIAGELHEYSHAFYGLPGGGSLAFFTFADPDLQKRYTAKRQEVFVHTALAADKPTQQAIVKRLRDAGHQVSDIDHGYTFSSYVTDPNGMLVEFCYDPANVDQIMDKQRATAHDSLRRWQSGDRTPNNDVRDEEQENVIAHSV